MLKRYLIIFSLVLPLFLVSGVFAEGKPTYRNGEIVATTNIVADLVQQIAGDDFQVVSLMRPGIDPHLYKATQGDIGRLSKAKVIFYNGLHLEGKMADVLKKLNTRIPTLGIADAIDPKKLREAQDDTTIYDPHVWFDPLLWNQTISPTVQTLSRVFPHKKEAFKKNAEQYQQKLNEIHQWTLKAISEIPKDRRVLVTAHDAFGYFGRQYGFEVVGLQGVSTTAEFGLGDLQRISDLVIKRKIPAVFVESSVPQRFVQALIEGTTAKGWPLSLGGELYSDSLGPEGGEADTYLKMVRYNTETISKALKKEYSSLMR